MQLLPKTDGNGIADIGGGGGDGADGANGMDDTGEQMDEREDGGVVVPEPKPTPPPLPDKDQVDGLVPNVSQALGSFLM
jgi:hypothetical protein